jgi:hypothetical protein
LRKQNKNRIHTPIYFIIFKATMILPRVSSAGAGCIAALLFISFPIRSMPFIMGGATHFSTLASEKPSGYFGSHMNKSFRPTTAQRYSSNSEMEIFESCERYEMVRLPDSMVPTTIFVGNLCEFVTDSMLSDLFQKVSTLSSVPACVVRKPSGSSLKYGFVTFLDESEKAVSNNMAFRLVYFMFFAGVKD